MSHVVAIATYYPSTRPVRSYIERKKNKKNGEDNCVKVRLGLCNIHVHLFETHRAANILKPRVRDPAVPACTRIYRFVRTRMCARARVVHSSSRRSWSTTIYSQSAVDRAFSVHTLARKQRSIHNARLMQSR
jgi:hypothetical protein